MNSKLKNKTVETVSNQIEIDTKMPKVRHVDFNYRPDTPKYWAKGNPFSTHLNNSFHIVFPAGEKFFIRSVRYYMDEITDPEMKKRLKAFISQEIIHGNAHEEVWDLLRQQDVDVDGYLKFYETTAYKFLEPYGTKLLGNKIALSVTVALEHYTAVMAEQALSTNVMDGMEPELKKLLQWHAAEEIEHRSVAFDLLKEVNPSYTLRISGFLLASFLLWFYGLSGAAKFLFEDKDFRKRGLWQNLKDFGKLLSIGSGGSFGKNWLGYFRPGFHPEDLDIDHYANAFLEKYGHEFMVDPTATKQVAEA